MPSTILSDNGVTSGTAGIKTTGSNDGQLALQTTTAGGTATTALTIDTSQNAQFAGTVFGLNLITGTVSVSGATTLSSTAFGKLHQCSGTSADYAVTLPAVSGNGGKVIAFQMSTALTKLVTITGSGAETIDGSNTRIMWAGETAVLYCDGTAWTKIGGKTIPMTGGQTVSTTQSVATGTSTKKTLGAASGANCPAYMNDTANSRIYVPRPSSYVVQFNSRITNATAISSLESLLYVNGSEVAITFAYFGVGYYPNAFSSITKTFSAGDYCELYVRQYTGANQTYGNYLENALTVTEIPRW